MNLQTDDYENKLIYEESVRPEGIRKTIRLKNESSFQFPKINTNGFEQLRNTRNQFIKQKNQRFKNTKGNDGVTFVKIVILVIGVLSLIFQLASLL